ncbi:uncharacterized protein CDV56_102264 [Aspergillus thermomutatus]|uniref:Uncharacterized protein n=1 Tax=Aspergillus thermomutatus TaxID=41047 RepID=A0A397G1P4_ASPTH|nr:uncharacterized protein CDV56_102264 [Aspergillus thermomutatus]RHZ44875.1 hypothetical protein CDV56_102264 [Aspergillus thermomutatus]
MDQLSLIAGSIGLLLAPILSLYTLQNISYWAVRLITTDHRPLSHGYKDRDGEAAPDVSQQTAQRPLRMVILALVLVGTAVSGLQTGMVARPLANRANLVCWAGVGIWVCLLLQCTALAAFHANLIADDPNTTLVVLAGVEGSVGATVGLLCLARAIIPQPKVMILDEATASVGQGHRRPHPTQPALRPGPAPDNTAGYCAPAEDGHGCGHAAGSGEWADRGVGEPARAAAAAWGWLFPGHGGAGSGEGDARTGYSGGDDAFRSINYETGIEAQIHDLRFLGRTLMILLLLLLDSLGILSPASVKDARQLNTPKVAVSAGAQSKSPLPSSFYPMAIHAHDVRNLVNGNVAGDQIGGSKFGGDQVAGNKITIEMRNLIFDPAILTQLGVKNPDGGISDDLQGICQLVASMILAELEENRSKPSHTIVGIPETRRALEEFHTLRYTATFDTSKGGPGINLSDILPLLAMPTLADPEATLHYYALMRKIRRRKEGHTTCSLRQSRRLQDRVAESHSSLLLVKGSFPTRPPLRDFAAGMIGLLQKEKAIVAWVLQAKSQPPHAYDTLDILKQLVSQILQQTPATVNERSASLTARRIRDASTPEDWFSVLGSVLGGIKQVYLVIETEAFADRAKEYGWSGQFASLFNELQARRISTTVKAIFISCCKPIVRQFEADCGTVIDAG